MKNNASVELDENHLTIQYPKNLKIADIAGILLFGAFTVINIGDLLLGWGLGTDADWLTAGVFALMTGLCVWGFSGIVLWKVETEDSLLRYTAAFGAKRQIEAAEIVRVEEHVGRTSANSYLLVYSAAGKILRIDENLPKEAAYFVRWCRGQKISFMQVMH